MDCSSTTLKIFAEYVDSALAQHGFALIAPQLAERRSPGLRQGVVITTEDMLGSAWVSLSTYSVFCHELDDGPTPDKLMTYDLAAGICSGSTMSEEGSLLSTLEMTMRIFLSRILRYGSVDAIVKEIESYPGSASGHVGSRSVVATFNLAHCLETIGRQSDAKALYVEAAEELQESDDALARLYADVARRRAETLTRVGTNRAFSAKSVNAKNAPRDDLALAEADQAHRPFYVGLLRYLESAHQNPAASYPSLLFRAMDAVYKADARPGFWKSVSSNAIMSIVKQYAPDFERDMASRSPTALTKYVRDLELGLYMRAFDELCAERLLVVPLEVRPETREDIYEWLMADFARQGEGDESEYLEREGLKGSDAVIRAMEVLLATMEPV